MPPMPANLLQPPAAEPGPWPGLGRLAEKPMEASLAAVLLVLPVAFNAYTLWAEVAIQVPSLNDAILHTLGLGTASTRTAG